jgi:hypothetical protein
MLNFHNNIKSIFDLLLILLSCYNAVATDGFIGGDTSSETAFILYVAVVIALVPDILEGTTKEKAEN